MKNLILNYRRIGILVLIFVTLSVNLMGQGSDKEVSHDEARLNTDAFALAYGTCKYELAKYASEQDPNNSMLNREFIEMQKTFRKFHFDITTKYQADEGQFEKFTRKVKNARKQLPSCILYDSMVKSNENIEKAKAEKSQ